MPQGDRPREQALSTDCLAEVAVDAPLSPGRTLTYAVRSPLRFQEGDAVSVPLGSRHVQGVVFELHQRPSGTPLRDVQGAVPGVPPLTPAQLALARWLSDEYFCSLFQAVSLWLPPGFPARPKVRLRLTAQGLSASPEALSQEAQQVLKSLAEYPAAEEASVLRRAGKGAHQALRQLMAARLVERYEARPRPAVGPRHRDVLWLAWDAQAAAALAGSLAAGRGARQAALLQALLAQGAMPASQARKEYGASAVSSLLRRGVLLLEQERVVRDPLTRTALQVEAPLVLTGAQAAAVDEVQRALQGEGAGKAPRPSPEGSGQAFLLEGVTGSGKTEVYLQALAQCVASGRRGIYLVPELSLTPQAVQRLSSRFPGRVGLYHSGLSAGEQYDTWWRIRQGDFDVVLGSRSALFTPQPDLGLIVIDEEHEWTYKQQDATPRYQAREAALKLAELAGAVVVLGSATPDVVTYHRALHGEHRLLRLPERLTAGQAGRPAALPLPQVQVVDMRQELKEGNRSIFSRALYGALESALRRGEQAVLFLNRRGSAGVVQCRECGFVVRCRRCDLPMTYHSVTERLQCHLCGAKLRPPTRCAACGGSRIRYLGIGTQRVAEEVRAAFGVPVLRWDRDAARERHAHQELMDRFTRGEAPVLVGTQMVAKGLHLPRVTVVGVILADIGLHVPELRAGERLFQTLCQVAGRAGRAELPGRVVIQTYAPGHYAVQAAARQDYQAFYLEEVTYRREHHNPPFSRLVRLMFRHVNAERCQEEAEQMGRRLVETLRREGLGEAEVVGPAPAFPARVRGHYRWQVMLRFPLSRAAEVTPMLVRAGVPPTWAVDVDPAD